MAFSMAGGGPSNPQINVTPLIDVLPVLIIVFMVVVSMSISNMSQTSLILLGKPAWIVWEMLTKER